MGINNLPNDDAIRINNSADFLDSDPPGNPRYSSLSQK